MLTKDNFTEGHIRNLQKQFRRDPALIERTIFAFGLLEAIRRVGMPFVFKGGTSLMLILKHPMRLSTDIDIVVEPATDVDMYVKEASLVFPFEKFEEQVRFGKNKIEKRHFKFTYRSPITGRDIYILLDILFEHNNYAKLVEKDIRNAILLTEPEYLKVKVPSVNCILGDKLTAFAPHTTGIPLSSGKDMEVMKQMFDICTLIDEFDDFEEARESYLKIVAAEIAYRGCEIKPRDALKDTIDSALCVASRGKVNEQEYLSYMSGARDVRTHIFTENYSPETAAKRAPKVMYFAACLIAGTPFEKMENAEEYIGERFINLRFRSLAYLRKFCPEAYAYAIKTDRVLAAL